MGISRRPSLLFYSKLLPALLLLFVHRFSDEKVLEKLIWKNSNYNRRNVVRKVIFLESIQLPFFFRLPKFSKVVSTLWNDEKVKCLCYERQHEERKLNKREITSRTIKNFSFWKESSRIRSKNPYYLNALLPPKMRKIRFPIFFKKIIRILVRKKFLILFLNETRVYRQRMER